jgi:uroporphyrinogen decarboxylase
MKSKERVLTALCNKEPDKVPIVDTIDDPIKFKLARIIGLDLMDLDKNFRETDLNCRLAEKLGLDWVDTYSQMGLVPIDDTHLRDKYGCVFIASEHGAPIVIDGPIKESKDLIGFEMVSKLTPDDLDNARFTVEKSGREKAIMVWLEDSFKLSWQLRGGMEHLLLDFGMNPTLVHDLARVTTDYNIALVEMLSKIGVDIVCLEGDLAGEKTTLMSPDHYREFVKPYQAEVVKCAHENGLKAIKHSDGNMWPIIDDHMEIGFDGLHPIQPDCMDIAEVKTHVDGKLCLIGNIDCRYLLCNGTEQEVEETTKQTIHAAAPGGGYMLMSSNSIHAAVKPENFLAMVRAAHKYGGYPM